MGHTLIFDIGKTNKKAFVFDENYQELYKVYSTFEEQTDADGFPCDDLDAIQNWIQQTIRTIFQEGKYAIDAINFSTYGASFVHLDKNGKPLTPLYNYLKIIPEDILQSFYKKYGDQLSIARETASPPLGMLNSGLQLYWLKHTKPGVFQKIRWSLHLPQYLSYLLTGIPQSEYTSIGCHTMLWDFAKNDYHNWVYAEEIDQILPPILNTTTSINTFVLEKKVKVGIGIHDSSAALLPYIRSDEKPFLLISTGTWSIALNPFNDDLLADKDLQNDCLKFMRVDGKSVKAARLFLGQEYNIQVQKLQQFYNKSNNKHQKTPFDENIYKKLLKNDAHYFAFEYLKTPWQQPKTSQLQAFQNFTEAYHQLMRELVQLQIAAAKRAIGQVNIYQLYIDGGFADNEIFVQMLARHFVNIKLKTTQSPLGSALGAAMVISDTIIDKDFLKNNYALKKHN